MSVLCDLLQFCNHTFIVLGLLTMTLQAEIFLCHAGRLSICCG